MEENKNSKGKDAQHGENKQVPNGQQQKPGVPPTGKETRKAPLRKRLGIPFAKISAQKFDISKLRTQASRIKKIRFKKIRFTKENVSKMRDKVAATVSTWSPRLTQKRIMWGAVGIIIVVMILIWGVGSIRKALFGKKKTTAIETVGEGIPVKVYKIKRMDFKDTLPVLGTMKGYKEISLKFQTSGILESFNFEEGERIQEGDIIANLEQRDALLKLKYAELELSSARKMYDVGAIIQEALEKTKLEYESARSDLEKTNIYAVADGTLGTQDIDVGTYVTPNDKVGVFVDVSRMYGEFDIIEKDVHKLKLGLKCDIYVDALPNRSFKGTVDIISPIIEGRTRTQKLRVELKNRDRALRPGMFARGLISTYEKKNALIIPQSSIKKKEEQFIIYVVNRREDQEEEEAEGVTPKDMGSVEIRNVTVSYMTQDRIEIEKGLEEGELIVMEVYQEFQDQEVVEIAEVQEILY